MITVPLEVVIFPFFVFSVFSYKQKLASVCNFSKNIPLSLPFTDTQFIALLFICKYAKFSTLQLVTSCMFVAFDVLYIISDAVLFIDGCTF